MRSDIVPGGAFPDYALPDHTGTVRALSELQGRDPLILTLARGNYCPKEHLNADFLRALVRALLPLPAGPGDPPARALRQLPPRPSTGGPVVTTSTAALILARVAS